jgi:hypothetical protein
VIPEIDEPPRDDDGSIEPGDADDGDEARAPAGTFLGALGQIAAAALVVLAVVALFIGGAVALRWIFR